MAQTGLIVKYGLNYLDDSKYRNFKMSELWMNGLLDVG